MGDEGCAHVASALAVNDTLEVCCLGKESDWSGVGAECLKVGVNGMLEVGAFVQGRRGQGHF